MVPRLLLTLALSWISLTWAKQGPSAIVLEPHQAALIGYGSLMNRTSLSKTLGFNYDGPMHYVQLNGFSRDFDVVMPNDRKFFEVGHSGVRFPDGIAYLDIVESPGDAINAVLFVVDRSLLPKLDQRESIYQRILVKPEQLNLMIHGDVFVYKGRDEFRLPNFKGRVSVRRTYVDLLSQALLGMPRPFQQGFFRTTKHANVDLIDDQMDHNFQFESLSVTDFRVPALSYCQQALGPDFSSADESVMAQ